MYQVTMDAMDACMDALKPGKPIGEVFDAYARTCDAAGMRNHRLNATGYSMGTTFSPNWMDWPMFYHGNPVPAEPNMVFFLHMILMDSDTNQAICFGHTVVVTETGCRPLSNRSLELVVKS
jgi:Xaa-Pro dipeptidase